MLNNDLSENSIKNLKRYAIHFLNLYAVIFLFSCSQKDEYGNLNLTKPEENRFTKVVLAENLVQPMQFEILKDGRVLFVEREGAVKVYEPFTQQVKVLANIPVSTGYYDDQGVEIQPVGEDGMQGVVLDPDFQQNKWVYLYYSPKEGNSGSILTRYKWEGDQLDNESKKVLLEVPNQRRSCCHLGGGLVFDSMGNLYLSTGDNTPNEKDGFAPLDERPGKKLYDSQRTSGNTNDLRGAILRIHPEKDGTYSIPKGNLFSETTENARSEIYTMGNRNPYRLSIDSKTGWLYWGEVGPHGTIDSLGRGPKSYDEFNQAKEAGNYGWPYFTADNKAYWDYNYATGESIVQFDPSQPINDSPNNTGLRKLPPARPAFIWYPQTIAKDFPIPGSGSNSAVGGPIYRRSDFNNPKRPFPLYYEGKWFITDWARGWIMAVEIDKNGNYKSMEPFLPGINLRGPNDMEFGPDGDLYVLEYGRGPYIKNSEAKLIRIEYNDGNRKPIVKASSNKIAGSAPIEVQLSANGTVDYDDDPLSYKWEILDNKGKTIQVINEANPVITLTNPGTYVVVLTVDDSHFTQKSEPIKLVVGNEPPIVQFEFHGANKSFAFPGQTINYNVRVEDKEDGSLADKEISPSEVIVEIEYLKNGFDLNEIEMNLQNVDQTEPVKDVIGRNLINQTNCNLCHTVKTKTIGPSLLQISQRYKGKANAESYLSDKIVNGGSGVWGDVAMPPHPTISESDIVIIIDYILSLGEKNEVNTIPVSGKYTLDSTCGKECNNNGIYIFKASYTDKGNNKIPPLTSSDLIILREPMIPVTEADKLEGFILNHQIGRSATITPQNSDAFIRINDIDLTGIKNIILEGPDLSKLLHKSDWSIEIRIDTSNGDLIGKLNNLTEKVESNSNVLVEIDTVGKRDGFDILHDVYIIFANNKLKKPFLDQQLEIEKIKFYNIIE